eukprot:scaffold1583_cov257-Pavlova_lutheri.AAC.2
MLANTNRSPIVETSKRATVFGKVRAQHASRNDRIHAPRVWIVGFGSIARVIRPIHARRPIGFDPIKHGVPRSTADVREIGFRTHARMKLDTRFDQPSFALGSLTGDRFPFLLGIVRIPFQVIQKRAKLRLFRMRGDERFVFERPYIFVHVFWMMNAPFFRVQRRKSIRTKIRIMKRESNL